MYNDSLRSTLQMLGLTVAVLALLRLSILG
jgi:hypothetical protein